MFYPLKDFLVVSLGHDSEVAVFEALDGGGSGLVLDKGQLAEAFASLELDYFHEEALFLSSLEALDVGREHLLLLLKGELPDDLDAGLLPVLLRVEEAQAAFRDAV